MDLRRNIYWKLKYSLLLSIVCFATGCGQHIAKIKIAGDPTSMVLDARGRYLYIACEAAGKIILWDTKKHARLSETEVDKDSFRLYLAQDNKTLKVLCRARCELITFSVPEMKLQDTMVFPDGPVALSTQLDKDELYIVCPDSNLLRPYVGNNPLSPLAVGRDPVDILWQPETDFLWIANQKGNEVVLVDRERYKVLKRVAVGINPCRLAFSAAEDQLFVLCQGQEQPGIPSKIYLVDLLYKSAGLAWQAGEGARDFILGPKGRYLFVVNKGNLSILSARTGVKVLEQKTGANPYTVVVSPDSSRVYISCPEEQAVFIHKLTPGDLD